MWKTLAYAKTNFGVGVDDVLSHLTPYLPVAISHSTLNKCFSFGYIAKGIVYILIGGFTLATVLGFSGGGGIEGPKGIIQWVSNQTFGNILVGLLGLGLLGYALWRIYRGIADPTREGHDPSGVIKRIGYVVSGLANGTLAVLALRLAIGGGGGGDGQSKQGMVAKMLAEPWGQWVVGIVGAIVIGVGLFQIRKGIKAEFVKDISWHRISNDTIKKIGRYGHIARGVVFGIIGYFLILAATKSSASEFKGTEGALEYLADNAYGLWLLGITAFGLLLYGVFAVMKGRYGRVA